MSARTLPAAALLVTWAVYASDDGVAWTPVPLAGEGFDATSSAYVLRFAERQSRFAKAVSLGVNAAATEVTELEAYGP